MSDGTAEVSASRYRVEEVLGKGGMGAVYRVMDERTGRRLALKRLIVRDSERASQLIALFRREYHTLAQLSHPSVIEVVDYGLDERGPYYTMELLEGSDLYEQAPVPYGRACALLHDVASSLSLLHSRRLVHRDVSSRNIRILPGDRAKLLDFGALVPMGPSEEVVGTAMYVAPEAVLGQPLDGRCDLYSLGVVLYHAVSGRFPYKARHLAELRNAWQHKPTALSALVPEIPPELERLTMSLIALDRAARPRDASEVMDRLSAIAGLERAEPVATVRAYLSAPVLVGRAQVLDRVRAALLSTLRGDGKALSLSGPPGVGRSRMLESSVLEAKMLGATVLVAGVRHAHSGAFATAQALIEQLHEAMPELAGSLAGAARPCAVLFDRAGDGAVRPADLTRLAADRAALIAALRDLWHLAAGMRRALVIALDDAHRIDEASVAALASALHGSGRSSLALIATLGVQTAVEGAGHRALRQRSEEIPLAPLTPDGTRELMRSVFGNVPNVEVVADRIHRLAHGRPRDAMALAEHLVERGAIRYHGGAWVLPGDLDATALPESMAEAFRQRTAALPPLARQLAEMHALSPQIAMSFDDYARLAAQRSMHEVYAAIDALVASDVLIADGHAYRFSHEGWHEALLDGLPEAVRRAHHLGLCALHEEGDPLAAAYHRLLGGDERGALELLEAFALAYTDQAVEVFDKTKLGAVEVTALLGHAFEAVDRLEDNPRLNAILEYFLMAMGVFVDDAWFTRLAPRVLARLKHESGWDHWQTLQDQTDPLARTLAALQAAQVAYDAMPEEQRAQTPVEAIQRLVQFTVAGIAIGARALDRDLIRSLPGLLEPFAPLTPIVDAMLHNAIATAESSYGLHEQARERFRSVLERVSDVEVAKLDHADEIRDALIYALALTEQRLGIATAGAWLDRLSDSPRHRINALTTRAMLCLQQGDWETAGELKRKAEQAAIESDQAQLFGAANLCMELELLALGLDLGGVKRLLDPIGELAERYPGWRPYAMIARATYDRLRGDPERALSAYEHVVAPGAPREPGQLPDPSWLVSLAGKLEVLLELGRPREAKAEAEHALARVHHDTSGVRYEAILRALALAEAQLGETDAARARLSSLIAHRVQLGTTGVYLGMLYETSARIALAAGDEDEFRHFAGLTAAEFLRRRESGLTARYTALIEAARQASIDLPGLDGGGEAVTAAQPTGDAGELVAQTLVSCRDRAERVRRGMALLCEGSFARGGHLFLFEASGLVHVASQGEEGLDPALERFMLERMRLELDGFDQPTATATSASLQAPALSTTWVGPRGDRYHRVLIEARRGGEHVLLGIAALRFLPETRRLPAVALDIGSALGDYFLEAGDALPDQASAVGG